MKFEDHHATPIDSIRAFCVQCNGYQYAEIPKCTTIYCPLFPYRMGKRPINSKLVGLSEAVNLSERNGC